MTAEERWLPIPGFEGWYEVSSAGRVKSLPRQLIRRNGSPYRVRGRILNPGAPANQARYGHRHVTLAAGRRGWYRVAYVNALVDEAFGNTTDDNQNDDSRSSGCREAA